MAPPLAQFGGLGRVAGDQGRAKLSRITHGREHAIGPWHRSVRGCGLVALASRFPSLTCAKRFGRTPHPTSVRSCSAKRAGRQAGSRAWRVGFVGRSGRTGTGLYSEARVKGAENDSAWDNNCGLLSYRTTTTTVAQNATPRKRDVPPIFPAHWRKGSPAICSAYRIETGGTSSASSCTIIGIIQHTEHACHTPRRPVGEVIPTFART